MPKQGRPQIPEDDQRRIRRMAEVSRPKSEIARVVGVSRPTAYKYAQAAEQQGYNDMLADMDGEEEKNF